MKSILYGAFAAVLMSGAAFADTVQFTTGLVAGDNEVSAFDASLGTLNSIRFDLVTEGSAQASSTATGACVPGFGCGRATANPFVTVTVDLEGEGVNLGYSKSGVAYCATEPVAGDTCTATAVADLDVTTSKMRNLPNTLAAFTGVSGSTVLLAYSESVIRNQPFSGPLNPDAISTLTASLTVTYDFTAAANDPSTVPLPAGMPLLLAGLGGLALLRRRR